ncbi:hypothetical protein [Limosilactobacillus difficilis]|nr:hypothetical protein [Limosilactobacillus difficilis]
MLPIIIVALILILSAAGQWYFGSMASQGKHAHRINDERKAN